MYDQVYMRIDDALWKDSGCGRELDCVEQSSWILFLKYLDDLGTNRQMEAELDGRPFEPILGKTYRWSAWAVPKKSDGSKDLAKTLTDETFTRKDGTVGFYEKDCLWIFKEQSEAVEFAKEHSSEVIISNDVP